MVTQGLNDHNPKQTCRKADGKQFCENDAGQSLPISGRPHFSARSPGHQTSWTRQCGFSQTTTESQHIPKLVPCSPSFTRFTECAAVLRLPQRPSTHVVLITDLILPQLPAFETGPAMFARGTPYCSLPPALAAVSIPVRKQPFGRTPG